MSKNKNGKELTYEEIGEKLGISPQQVHKIEKEAFNKIIRGLQSKMGLNIFEVILTVCQYFAMEPEQCYNKLDKENHNKLCEYIQDEYGHIVDGWEPKIENWGKFFH